MSNSHSSPARIIILGNGSLLDEGVTNILSLHPQLSVTNFPYTDDNTLYDLVNSERPNTVFINESNAFDMGQVIGLIFSVPSASVRCVIVVHAENSRLDVYYRPATRLPVKMYRRKSVMVDTKEEFINLALDVSC